MITALGRVHFDRDNTREDMVDSLKGLKAGAEVRAVAERLDEQVKELGTDMRQSWRDLNRVSSQLRSCRSIDRCQELKEDFDEKKDEVQELRDKHWELAEEITEERNDAFEELEDIDGLSRSELREYRAPFSRLAKKMEEMVDARRLGASNVGNRTSVTGYDPLVGSYDTQSFLEERGLPSDFYEVRGGNVAMRRSNGLYTPNQYLPMGSQQNVGFQQQQNQYLPAYMQGGGQQQFAGAIPLNGGGYFGGQQNNFGQPNYAGGGQSLLPPPQGGMNRPGMQPQGGAIPAPRM